MDLAYLRAHPEHLPTMLRHQRIRETPVAGGDICDAARLTLDDGRSVFLKTWPEQSGPVPAGFFAAEAAGLRWLRAELGRAELDRAELDHGESDGAGQDRAGQPGPPVPEVLVELDTMLVTEWVQPGEPSPRAAEDFGRALAALHRTGADGFGADWPGFIGRLPLDNTPSPGPWTRWFAERRLTPYLRLSMDHGALDAADVTMVERVIAAMGASLDEPPSRLHGDLWPGNLHWAADGRVWLVDPAAHGGHRETDLALLGLFGGAPYLDRILAAYQEVWPLAEGWPERVPLHQLYLLLVHTASFGAAYRDAVRHACAALPRHHPAA